MGHGPFRPQGTNPRLIGFLTALAIGLGSGLTFSQNPPQDASKAPSVITYLTETINWYRGRAVEQRIATEPSDLTFAEDNRRSPGRS